jgi:hypothetical protein
VTIRTFPDVPIIASSLNVTMPSAEENFWAVVQEFHTHLPALNDADGSGYYYIVQNQTIPSGGYAAVFSLIMIFANQTNVSSVDDLFAPLVSSIQNLTGSVTYYMSRSVPSASLSINSELTGADYTGSIGVLGSRLISRDFLVTSDGPSKLSQALSSLQQRPGETLMGVVVAGGQVSRNGGLIDSALNPAWRKAITHMLFSRGWLANTTLAEQNAIRANITNTEVPILKSLEPGQMGAYLNEADADEADFQTSFWGDNYNRLYEIKKKWDADGLFISRRGVGSEDWDDDGFCRIK